MTIEFITLLVEERLPAGWRAKHYNGLIVYIEDWQHSQRGSVSISEHMSDTLVMIAGPGPASKKAGPVGPADFIDLTHPDSLDRLTSWLRGLNR
jgi:hypothetical protein